MRMSAAYTFMRQIPVYASADVIVVGGGPAGTAAAIGAARCGKKVILLEKSGQLGGMGTLGNVSIFMPIGNVTGIYREFIAEMLNTALPPGHDGSIAPQFSPFILRQYLNEKMRKEGVQTFFHAEFVGTVASEGKVEAVIVSTREGLQAIQGLRFIDCTGDARMAIELGVPFTSGRDSDGMTQPMTLMFMMQNTGKPVRRYLPEGCPFYQSLDELPQGRHLYWEQNDDGMLLVNMTRVRGNGARIADVNAAEPEALRQVFSVVDYLQRNGFENYALSHVAGQAGVRETNQIQGLYTLTESDITSGRRFDDVVAQSNYEIDIHSPDGHRTTDERHVDGYDIPYRCMVPMEYGNLLVAGRAISATHVAMSSMRVQATCYALGQAAGIASSLSIDRTCECSAIPIDELHAVMAAQNVRLWKPGRQPQS